MPGESDENWSHGAIVVVFLLENLLDVLADGCKGGIEELSACQRHQ